MWTRPTGCCRPTSRRSAVDTRPARAPEARAEPPEARAELRAGAEAATAYAELADEASAARYVDKHTRRLAAFGISDATVTSLAVNEELSRTTRAALDRG